VEREPLKSGKNLPGQGRRKIGGFWGVKEAPGGNLSEEGEVGISQKIKKKEKLHGKERKKLN